MQMLYHLTLNNYDAFPDYTLSHLSAHVVNRLLRKNWKSIPFFNGIF